MSLSDLARAAGFGRGFPGDVISGKRRLTLKSCQAFERALELPAPGRKLFRLLVAREERDLFPDLSPAAIEKAITRIREMPWNRSHREAAVPRASRDRDMLSDPKVLAVYAAAGSPEHGALLEEIRSRTGLQDAEAKVVVSDLQRIGLLAERGGRIHPTDFHLFLKGPGKDEFVLKVFRQACMLATQRAREALESEREMFFASSFCVDERRMPELKAALRKTVLRFVDESIDPEGSRVVRLLTALHS